MEPGDQRLPKSLIDPITYAPFSDPVLASDGHTYERSVIVEWFKQCRQLNHPISSPLTRECLDDNLKDNIVVKQLIAELNQKLQEEAAAAAAADASVPKVVLPRISGSVASLASLAQIFEAADPFRGTLQDLAWEPPQVVVMGNENSGKSTLLERIAMMPLFPIDKRICTRMAIKICLRRGEPQPPLLQVHELASKAVVRSKHFAIDAAASYIEEWMYEEVRRENNGRVSGVCRDRMLVIHIQSSTIPNLDLVDLPGLVATNVQGEPADMSAQTRQLVEDFLDRHTQHSLFLVTVPANGGANQSIAMDIVQQRNLQPHTIGVLTKADLLVFRDADEDDEAEVHSRLEELHNKLDQQSPDIVPLHPHGYVATMNKRYRATSQPDCQYLTKYDGLLWQAERELSWFQSKGFDDGQRVGSAFLLRWLTSTYHEYVVNNWLPGAMKAIQAEVSRLQDCGRKLGLPHANEIQTTGQEEIVNAAKDALAELFDESTTLSLICNRLHSHVLDDGELLESVTITEQIWQCKPRLKALQEEQRELLNTCVRQCAKLCQHFVKTMLETDQSDFQFGRFPRAVEHFNEHLQQRLDGWQVEVHEAVGGMLRDYYNNTSFKYTHSCSKRNATVTCTIDFSMLNGAISQTILESMCNCLSGFCLEDALATIMPREPDVWLESCAEERTELLAYTNRATAALDALSGLNNALQTEVREVEQLAAEGVETKESTEPSTKISKSIAKHAKRVLNGDSSQKLRSMQALAQIVSEGQPSRIQQVIDTGVLPHLVPFLQRDDAPELQIGALKFLHSVAKSFLMKLECRRAVVEANGIPALVRLMGSQNQGACSLAVEELGNIVNNSVHRRDLALECGALSALLQLLEKHASTRPTRRTSKSTFQSYAPQNLQYDWMRNGAIGSATCTLAKLCNGTPTPDLAILQPALPHLARLIKSDNEIAVKYACLALSFISDGSSEHIQAVLDSGAGPQLVCLLSNDNFNVKGFALQVVASITQGDDEQVQQIIDLGVLGVLVKLLEHAEMHVRHTFCPFWKIRDDASWALSNITQGTGEHVQAVIDTGVVPQLLELLRCSDPTVRYNAGCAIEEILSHNWSEQRNGVGAGDMQQQAVKTFCGLLAEGDTALLIDTIDLFERIFKASQIECLHDIPNSFVGAIHESEVVDKIRMLLQHQRKSLHFEARRILRMCVQ